MREILFRGKRCDNGKWVQGYYIRAEHHWHNHGIHKDWIICGASANGGWFALHNKYAVKAETAGQYTGLTDKNGKKIFEGDILIHAEKYRYKVFWCNDRKGFYVRGINFSDYDYIGNFYTHTIEVIGNIHDNPELMEGNV